MFGKLRMLMNSGSVLGYFLQALPIACLAGLVCFLIRISILKKRKAQVKWPAEILRLLFVCYLAGLISLVILPANFWLTVYDGIFFGWWNELGHVFQIGDINLVPSVVKWLSGKLSMGHWVKTMLIGNIVMFIPLGFFIPLVTGIKSCKKMILIAVAIPICCEVTQMFFGRSFDVDDLIGNFIGIIIGTVVSLGILKIKSSDKCAAKKQENPCEEDIGKPE